MLRTELAGFLAFVPFRKCHRPSGSGGSQSSSFYQFTLYGSELQQLYKIAPEFQEKIKALPGVIDVTSDLLITSPQLLIDIDRDKAASLGITAQQIENVLYGAFGSKQVSTIYTPTNQYFVIMELDDRYQRDQRSLSLLYLRNNVGKLIPLEAVSQLKSTVGPLSIAHMGQLPAVTISFNLAPDVSLSGVTTAIQRLAIPIYQSALAPPFKAQQRPLPVHCRVSEFSYSSQCWLSTSYLASFMRILCIPSPSCRDFRRPPLAPWPPC